MYAYTGPEVARLKTRQFRLEVEKNEYERRVKKDAVIAGVAGGVFLASVVAGFGLGTYLAANGPLEFAPGNPAGLALVGLSFVPAVSFYTCLGATGFLLYNAIRVEGKKASLAQISEELKQVEKGTFQ